MMFALVIYELGQGLLDSIIMLLMRGRMKG